MIMPSRAVRVTIHEIYASGIEKMYNDEDVWDSATTTKEELVEFIGIYLKMNQ